MSLDNTGKSSPVVPLILIGAFLVGAVIITLSAESITSPIASISKTLEGFKNVITNSYKNNSAAVVAYTGKQLVSKTTYIKNSGGFAPERPVDHLWDGCTIGTPSCVSATPDLPSFFVEFDFGTVHTLEAARLYGAADGTSFSEEWSLEYKKDASDAWGTAFAKSSVFGNGWFDKTLANVAARYIRVTVASSRLTSTAVEARELEVYGVPLAPETASSTSATSTAPKATVTTVAPQGGTTYFVAPNGDDSNPGTFELPFKSPQRAVDTTQPGDTIELRAGTYKEGVLFARSGTKEKPIIFKNFPDERPVFDFGVTTAASPVHRIELLSTEGARRPISFIVIEGLELTHGPDAIKFNNAEDITIRNNTIRDTLYAGILGVGGSRVSITGNRLHRIGIKDLANSANNEKHHALHLTGSDYKITNNIIDDVRTHGIRLAAQPFGTNLYADERFSGGKNALIANNVIAHTRFGAAISLWQDTASSAKILNNIFYQNRQNLGIGEVAGIEFISAGAGHVASNNIFYNPGKLNFSYGSSGLVSETKNSSVDPLFVYSSTADFHLTALSPAVDSGVSVADIATDILGTSRPSGCYFDIGAYEFPIAIPGMPPIPTQTALTPPTAALPSLAPPIISPPPPPQTLAAFPIGSQIQIATPYTLRIRTSPSITVGIAGKRKPGSVAMVIDGPQQADNLLWYKVIFTDGLTGWAAGEFLITIVLPQKLYGLNTHIKTILQLSVRETPGGIKKGQQAQGSRGTIVETVPIYKPFNDARWWWKIDYAQGPDGWSAADFISTSE